MLAAIPYTTFPDIELGPFTIRTFGLMVGIGVLLGAWIAGRYIEANAGVQREETYRMATRLVVAGVIGARLTWDLSHWDQIDSPLDLIAVWEGGLQFSGGFLGAIIFGLPFFRRWDRRTRWVALDGYAYGLSLGLAIGRIGCYSVGEHFGSTTTFFLGTRYDGGSVREGRARRRPAHRGHRVPPHRALRVPLPARALRHPRAPRAPPRRARHADGRVLRRLRHQPIPVGLPAGQRRTVLGLTGAQYLMAGIALASIWIFKWVRPALAALPVESDEHLDESAGGPEDTPPTAPDLQEGAEGRPVP